MVSDLTLNLTLVAGDLKDGKTTTLCVRRATYWCPELKADDPAKKGVCSNYLCDAKPGDEIKLTGPSGKVRPLDFLSVARVGAVSVARVGAVFAIAWLSNG